MRRPTIPVSVVAALIAASALAPIQSATGAEPEGRIVGGTQAEPSSWPYAAALFYSGRLGCAGSVVAPTKVLTAAHCVAGVPKRILRVVTGRPNLRKRGIGQRIAVAGYKVHPGFRRRGIDFAILNLAQPTTVEPVALADRADGARAIRVRRRARVAGWGARSPYGFRLSAKLRKTNEFVLPNRRCARAYGRDYNGRFMICALGARRKPSRFFHRSSCGGDSGGPLVSDATGEPRLIGVVSFGGPICGYRLWPSVYARVPAALGWIAPRI